MSTAVKHAHAAVRYRADVDGLRGVAILLVVAFHVGIDRFFGRLGLDFPVMGGGFVGVDVFYVISGFLITSLLLREHAVSGGIDLRAFYARRIRRLLPSAALVLVVTLVMSWYLLAPIDLAAVGKDAVAAAFYVSNIWFAAQATDYMAGDVVESPVLHYWSLSLEEQFYLIWPWVVALVLAASVARSRRRALVILTSVVIAGSFAASVLLTQISAPWAYFGLPTRAWELGIGAALALAAGWFARLPRAGAELLTAGGLMAVLGSAVLLSRASEFPGWVAAVPVVGSAAVIAGGLGGSRTLVGRALSLRPLVYVGGISYVWYLWHWPFIVLAGPAVGALGRPSAAVVLGAAALSFGVAALTHRYFENPIRRSRLVMRGWRPYALAAASAGVVAMVSVPLVAIGSTGDTDATAPAGARADRVRIADGCGEDFLDTEAAACTFGDEDGSMVVALLGDSHAMHMVPAVEPVASDRGWRMLLFTKASCPPVDVRRWLPAYNREYVECDRWRDDVARQLAAESVDLVLISRYGGYADNLIDENGDRVPAEGAAPVWQAGAERTFLEYRTLGADVVVLRDVPNPGVDVPSCISGSESDSACSFPHEGHVRWDEGLYGAEVMAASGMGHVEFLDLSASVCGTDPCEVRDPSGVIKYRDANHLTATFSASLSGALGRALPN